jgi:uncharacterized protein YndB with AHSA1/START domain
MPKDKDLKRLVRARMEKTGEAYTAARAALLDKKHPTPADYEKLAGMSDATLKDKTGRSWKQWVRALDAAKANTWKHSAIARHIAEQGVSGWWSQTVTVGYERIRGLREVGQRLDGKYEANKSRTFPVAIGRVYNAFAQKRVRDRWLGDIALTVRKTNKNTTVRMTWPDETSVTAYFVPKGRDKTQVAIQHEKLRSKADVEKRKAFWQERLDALTSEME